MTFEVEVGTRQMTVSVEPVGAVEASGGRFRVVVRGAAGADSVAIQQIDVRRNDLGFSLLFEEAARQVAAAVTQWAGEEVLVQFPHASVTAVVDGRRARHGSSGQVAGTGEHRVNAPMPGRVVRVLVKPGDEVAVRQGVVVVEAMKMENELTAARAGRVKEVSVTEGQSVHAGQLLVIVE
jgi:biotin carboxyl carrier protein